MDKYTIIVMDYALGSLRFFHFNYEPKDPEAWLEEHDPLWKDTQCYWMGVKDSEVGESHEWIN